VVSFDLSGNFLCKAVRSTHRGFSVRAIAATAVATIAAPQVITFGEDHRVTFPIKVFSFNEGFWRGHDWIMVFQHLD
jgi:hypothetical protein